MKVQLSVKESVNLFVGVVIIVYLFRTAKQPRNAVLFRYKPLFYDNCRNSRALIG